MGNTKLWLLITALTLPLFYVPSANATGLGVADGTYNISLQFFDSTYNATGSFIISQGLVSSFHVDSNPTLGLFDCGTASCAELAGDPDTVYNNSSSYTDFNIVDNAPASDHTSNSLFLLQYDPISISGRMELDNVNDPNFFKDGNWLIQSYTLPVPEPDAATLTLLGLVVLGLFGWSKAERGSAIL